MVPTEVPACACLPLLTGLRFAGVAINGIAFRAEIVGFDVLMAAAKSAAAGMAHDIKA
jgi:hypothetical protein